MNLLQRRRDDSGPRRMRKGMYLLPSLFTTANLFAGFYAISEAVQGSAALPWHFDYAAIAIGFAVLFDGMDGAVARFTHTTSDFGREFDSLADCVTFGVAPALLAWNWGLRALPAMPNPDLRAKLVQVGFAIALHLSGRRRGASGALQHRGESATVQSGPPRPQIFCGHADSGRRGLYRCGNSPCLRRSYRTVVVLHHLDLRRGPAGVFDGEPVAILERQKRRYSQPASVLADSAIVRRYCADPVFLALRSVCAGALLHGFRCGVSVVLCASPASGAATRSYARGDWPLMKTSTATEGNK